MVVGIFLFPMITDIVIKLNHIRFPIITYIIYMFYCKIRINLHHNITPLRLRDTMSIHRLKYTHLKEAEAILRHKDTHLHHLPDMVANQATILTNNLRLPIPKITKGIAMMDVLVHGEIYYQLYF